MINEFAEVSIVRNQSDIHQELEAALEEQETEQDVTVTTAKMDKIQEMYNDFMVEEMRTLLVSQTVSFQRNTSH